MAFLGKNLNLKFLAKKDPEQGQNNVFQASSKINAWSFSDFLHEVTLYEITAAYKLEIDSGKCFGRNLLKRF